MELLKKLQIKPGYKFKVIKKPAGLDLPVQNGSSGLAVLFFAEDKKALQEILKDKQLVSSEYLWIAYPKGSSKKVADLNRDILAAESKEYGLDSVRLISIDDTWSAMRFKKLEA
jgi:hypothetical protein